MVVEVLVLLVDEDAVVGRVLLAVGDVGGGGRECVFAVVVVFGAGKGVGLGFSKVARTSATATYSCFPPYLIALLYNHQFTT
jgi:hypothetical protein